MFGRLGRGIRDQWAGFLALFLVVSGGTAWALSPNSVGTQELKPNAVHASDVARNAISSPKVKDGSLRAIDFAPAQLPQGPRGETGPPGEPGPAGRDAAQVSQVVSQTAAVTSSTSYVDLGFPSITLDVEATSPGIGFVEVSSWGTGATAGAGNAVVGLFQDGQPLAGSLCNGEPALWGANTGGSFNVTAPGQGCGISGPQGAPGILLFQTTPGKHTYQLRYRTYGTGTSSFQDVTLWMRPAA